MQWGPSLQSRGQQKGTVCGSWHVGISSKRSCSGSISNYLRRPLCWYVQVPMQRSGCGTPAVEIRSTPALHSLQPRFLVDLGDDEAVDVNGQPLGRVAQCGGVHLLWSCTQFASLMLPGVSCALSVPSRQN